MVQVLSKEEYKRELVRMWDSVREVSKGRMSCGGVECEVCPFDKLTAGDCPTNVLIHAMEVMEIVEKWSKENPIVTNRDKFKEVFGLEMPENFHDCIACTCPVEGFNDNCDTSCNSCPYNEYWEKEYQEPKREVE